VEATEQRATGALSEPSADEALATLRGSFRRRLNDEQARLANLAASLRTTEEPALVYGDIAVFAHRLRGAALVFEFTDVGDAAKWLELGAARAVQEAQSPIHRLAVVSLMRDVSTKIGLSAEPVEALAC